MTVVVPDPRRTTRPHRWMCLLPAMIGRGRSERHELRIPGLLLPFAFNASLPVQHRLSVTALGLLPGGRIGSATEAHIRVPKESWT